MATMISGLAETSSPVAASLKVDMADKVTMLDQDVGQFTTMLMKISKERAQSFKHE